MVRRPGLCVIDFYIVSLTVQQPVIKPHQYGEFWIVERKQWHISRVGVEQVANALGFCLFRGQVHRVIGKFIKESNEREFQDVLRSYIQLDGGAQIEVCNALEAFMQRNGKYTMSRLQMIERKHLLNDDEQNCFKFFLNGFIHITSEGFRAYSYDQFTENRYILYSKVQQRDYALQPNGLYLDFLTRSTDWERQSENIKTIIGYLSHEFKDETTGYIIVLTEQCPDPKDGGGSGKNLFCNLLSHTTTYCSKNGKQVKYDEKFFQSWSGQRVMGISDVPKNFDFEFLKEPSTGTFILKKLFKDEIEIPVADGPKFIVQTNYSYELSDGGLKRRIIPIEFTDFFTKSGGVDSFYGCHFPKGWATEDWNNFDTIIIESIQMWLKSNRKIKQIPLTETGWRKQFEHSHGVNLTAFIEENFSSWVDLAEVKTKDITQSLHDFYAENDIDKRFHYSSVKINSSIREWAKYHGYTCQPNVQRKMLGVNYKVHLFTKDT